MTEGKFIVIDGTDGSGKATQVQLLKTRLDILGIPCELADFPQYGQKSAGLVEEYLNGKYGPADEVGPYRASIFYACDRYDASFKIRHWLDEGSIVISNRYVTANMGHQGGKIKDDAERKKYFDWLYALEYETFGIPKPDLNLILHVDAAVAQKLVDNKGARDYVGGAKRDIHEADLEHLRNAERTYLQIAESFPNFKLVECTRNGDIMGKDEISNLVWSEIAHLVAPQPAHRHLHGYDDNAPNFYEYYHRQTSTSPIPAEKLTPTAKLPTRAHATDAGLDLYSDEACVLAPGELRIIKTGIRLAVPEGCVGLIWDKSGIAKEGVKSMGGVIDTGYRGEVCVILNNLSDKTYDIKIGQKIAQLLIQRIELFDIRENNLDDGTDRGQKGFGSTGLR